MCGCNFIEIYNQGECFILTSIDSNSSDSCKSKSIRGVSDHILKSVKGCADVHIIFHHIKGYLCKLKFKTVNVLTHKTNGQIINFTVISQYIGLLYL
jgi:hypothetical protein